METDPRGRAPIAIVCGNDTHAHMFAPVAKALTDRGVRSVVVSLDCFYRQRATATAKAYGLDVVEPSTRRGGNGRGFYSRPILQIWRDVLQARPAIDQLVTRLTPEQIVLGNDFGLIEKLVMARSRHLGVRRRVLVQDGRLGASRPSEAEWRRRVLRTAKTWISPALRLAGLPYLAASEYGQGGAELICATGPAGASLLSDRAGGRSHVIVTGQPRYDRLARLQTQRSSDRIRRVAIFTTPFATAGFGKDAQRAQETAVGALGARLQARGVRVMVKPHPRELPEPYRALMGQENVLTEDPAAILARADLAVIGSSSLLEEAALLECPVVVPGALVHGTRFDAALPDAAFYPRFDSLEEADRLFQTFDGSEPRAALAVRQRRHIDELVSFERDHPAADAVADAIMLLW